MNTDDNSLDDILGALAVSNITPLIGNTAEPSKDTFDENAELNKTLQDLDNLTKSNAAILEEAKRLVETTGDVEFIEVYASVAKSQAEAIKNKVKLLTDKEHSKTNKILKERELTLKEKVAEYNMGRETPDALPAGTTLNQTNVILSGSREEMFDMILQMREKAQSKDQSINT